MGTWTDEIEATVEGIKKTKKASGGHARKNVSKLDPNTLWLFGIILLLVAGVYVAYQGKNANPYLAQTQPYNQQQWDNGNYNPYNPYNPAPVNPDPNPYTPSMTPEQRMDRLESAARKIWERTKWNSDRLTLLATVNNHNNVVIKNALPRQELILLNSDWTINRLPDRIQLDSQDKEFLKQYIRK